MGVDIHLTLKQAADAETAKGESIRHVGDERPGPAIIDEEEPATGVEPVTRPALLLLALLGQARTLADQVDDP